MVKRSVRATSRRISRPPKRPCSSSNIMRKLRRQAKPNYPPARAAVVVPDGTLFGDGVCARIKEELLRDFNLHAIVRLPSGVFAPNASIPTNLLFFDRSGPTRVVWYYEQPLPEGRKNYTKTAPIQFEEFADYLRWWKKREENEHAWRVSAEELLATACNLDRKNPRGKEDIAHLPPDQLAASIEQRTATGAFAILRRMMRLGVAKSCSARFRCSQRWRPPPPAKASSLRSRLRPWSQLWSSRLPISCTHFGRCLAAT
jgi:hypothetical protein